MAAASKLRIKHFLFVIAGPAMLGAAFLVLYESAYLPSAQGTIRDSAGNPVAGAIVFGVQQIVEKQTRNFHGYSRRRCARVGAAITDASGHFVLDGGSVSIPKGWDFETSNVQYHVIAKGYRSTTVGGRLKLTGIGERPAEQATGPGGRVDAVMHAVNTDQFVSPWFVEALQHCEIMRADLVPANLGFAKVFENANPKSENIHQRKWLNIIGNIALRARFLPNELPESSQPLTNELIRELLSGNVETANAQISFRQAVITNDVDRIRDLLESGVDMNFDDGYRYSRLALALDHESHDAYRLLRENGADWREGEAERLLFLLVRRGDAVGVEVLAKEGVRADVFIEEGRNAAFIEAAEAGRADVLELLLSHDLVADIDATYGDKSNALQKAFAKNRIQAFRVLLAFGANPNGTDKYGRSLFENAVLSRPDFAFVMLDHGLMEEADSRGHSLFTKVINRDNRPLAEAMLKAGFSPAAASGTAPLAAAARNGWQDMVHEMLQHPDSPPGSDAWWNALWITASSDSPTFGYLLESYDGPLSDPPLKYGCVICRAATEGKQDIAERLLARGLPVDIRASDGETALMRAAKNGQFEMVEFLLDNGADPSLVDTKGGSAIAYAADGGDRETRERERNSGMSAMVTNPSSDSVAVSTAKRTERTITMTPLDLEDRPSHEPAPAAATVTIGSPSTTSIGFGFRRARPPVVVPGIVESLLQAGANPDITDEAGWTALMRAAAVGETQVVELLLENGADRKLKNNEGSTAADIAADAGHGKLASILR